MSATKIAASIALSGILSMSAAGIALGADGTDASISNTGPSSTTTVDVDNHNSIDITNQNQVSVSNQNNQTAQTGDASIKDNTNAGSASTGDARNNSTTTTDITIGSILGKNVSPENVDNHNGEGSGGGKSSGSQAGSSAGEGGGQLGVGGGELPVTGPSSPLDVSALRKVFSPSTSLAAGQKSAAKLSGALLAGAALLSLLGAVGTAVYAGKKEATA